MLQRRVLIAALLLVPSLLFADVVPDWHAGFGAPPTGLGLDGDPRALLHHNDSVFCGGSFSQAGSTTSWFVSRLDESFGDYSWTNIGDLNNRIDAMVAWGDSVLAGGRFSLADGVTVNKIAVFDGVTWHPVGAPGAWTWGNVLSLTMHEGLPWAAGTDFVVRWNGTTWVDAVGAGLSGDVFALASYNDDVYMAGAFSSVPNLSGDPTTADNIARWDGVDWQPVGSGLDDTGYAMTVWRDKLVVGGVFGSPAALVAKWNGSNWSALGAGVLGQYVTALAPWGARLVVGGDLTGAGGASVSDIAWFDEAVWGGLGDGVDGMVRAVSAKDGNVVGGGFLTAGATASSHIGLWMDPTVGVEGVPGQLDLTAWPNPFNPSTTLSFEMSHDSPTRLEILDLRGRLVNVVMDEKLSSGQHRAIWNGTDTAGRIVDSGVYFAKLNVGGNNRIMKLVLLK